MKIVDIEVPAGTTSFKFTLPDGRSVRLDFVGHGGESPFCADLSLRGTDGKSHPQVVKTFVNGNPLKEENGVTCTSIDLEK